MNSNEINLQSIVKEIESKYNKLGNFIKHNYTEGVFREKILKEIFENYLSSAVGIKNGFIKSSKNEEVSKQMDIVLTNENVAFSSYYKDKDFIIARSDSVICVVEVKSNFTKKSLKEVNQNLLSIKNINTNIRYSAFFYKTGTTNQNTIDDWMSQSFILPEDYMFYPDRLAIFDYGSFILSKNKSSDSWTLTFCKPTTEDPDELKSQILTDFIANTVGYCCKIINHDKSNVFEELGFGTWKKFEKISYK